MNKIIVTGHPYAFPYYFKVFEYVENKNDFVFILPKLWLAKNGKIKIKLEPKPGFKMYGFGVASYGGHGIKGLFKGWLPGTILLLPYLRIKYQSKVIYSCSEPNLLTTLFNGLMAKICGMRYVIFTWQNVDPEKYMSGLKLRIYKILVRFNLFLADGVICGNKKAQEIIKKLKPKNYNLKTTVCPLSGVDIDKFSPGLTSDWKAKLGFEDKKVLLFYGALDKRKGVNYLIEAFKNIPNDLDVRLLIIGTGPEKDDLKLKTKNYPPDGRAGNLETKVIFLDWMANDELPKILNIADVFVYPSIPDGGWEEQFGYAMAEASACGVPVVATRTGSINEVVHDDETGFLVEHANPKQLAGALVRVLTEGGLKQKMGDSGRKYISENFSHHVVAKKISHFLKSFV